MRKFRQNWFGYLPIALAVVLIVTLAVVQGQWSDRWSKTQFDAQQLADLLDQVPLKIGPWQGEDQEASERELNAAGAIGHVTRVYKNVDTGEKVSLFIICGHMRDVSVHTPDRCYPRAGFTSLGAPVRTSIAAEPPAEFFTTKFRKSAPEGIQDVRVFWTWGHESDWTAPQNPRAAFHGVRGLYKMYLIDPHPQSESDWENGPCGRFGQVLLPILSKTLFPEKKSAAGTSDTDSKHSDSSNASS